MKLYLEKMENYQPLLILFFAFLLFLRIVMKKKSKPKLPPGPWKLPFIGNMHQVALLKTNPDSVLPHRFLTILAKKYGPVMHLQMGEIPVLVISSPEAAKEVMKVQDQTFSDRPHLVLTKVLDTTRSDVFFSPYNNYWRQLRKIFRMDIVSSTRINSFKSLREEEVANLIKSISSSVGAPFNLTNVLYEFAHRINCATFFGKKTEDEDEFISAIEGIKKIGTGFDVIDTFPSYKSLHWIGDTRPQLKNLHIRTDKTLDKIIYDHQTRKENGFISLDEFGREDLIDLLLKYQEGSDVEVPVTKTDIKAIVVAMFAAETDTSTASLEWTMSELLRNPSVMEKVQAEVRHVLKGKNKIDETDMQEMHYMKLVIKETLRLHPSLPLLLPRETREACKLFGYDIPIKTKTFINAWAIGRDPKYWENPDQYYPDRFLDSPIDYKGGSFEYIPFGSGRRMCPGLSFGIANLELPLAQLLYHFDWKLPNGTKPEELDMAEKWGLSVTRINNLIVNAFPYTPTM